MLVTAIGTMEAIRRNSNNKIIEEKEMEK